jgi:hypothetical protein
MDTEKPEVVQKTAGKSELVNSAADAPTIFVDTVRVIATNPTDQITKIVFVEQVVEPGVTTNLQKCILNLVMSKRAALRLADRINKSIAIADDNED